MKIITLCGSTKFKKEFREVEAALTLMGHIVISLGFFEQSEGFKVTDQQASLFEKIHYGKIDISEEIFVIDVNGYIGSSTKKEIEYARGTGKAINYYSQKKDMIKRALNEIQGEESSDEEVRNRKADFKGVETI